MLLRVVTNVKHAPVISDGEKVDLTGGASIKIITISEPHESTNLEVEAMMRKRLCSISGLALIRRALWTIGLGAMLLASGCGGDSHKEGNAAKYPTGISEDVEQQLKYDARVDSFEPDGENLIVHVNESWLHSPAGMQERAAGQWYSLWHSNHSGGIIVQHDGTKVASWTSEHGFMPASESKKDEPHSES